MCNACGFLCCASDRFEGCGCDHCAEPACWPRCDFCGEWTWLCACETEETDEEAAA